MSLGLIGLDTKLYHGRCWWPHDDFLLPNSNAFVL